MTMFQPGRAGFPHPRAIGFDHLFRAVERALSEAADSGYPPHDIVSVGEDGFRIDLAVAGFAPEQLSVTVERNILTVAGRPAGAGEEPQRIHRGIARRAFERRFVLAENIEVSGAGHENGLLSVHLRRVVPERDKPRSIPVQAAAARAAIEAAPAA